MKRIFLFIAIVALGGFCNVSHAYRSCEWLCDTDDSPSTCETKHKICREQNEAEERAIRCAQDPDRWECK